MVYSILMKNCHFLPKWVFFVHHLPQLAKFLADNASRRIDANTMMIDAFNREGFIKIKASLCQLTNHHLKIGQQYPKCWLKSSYVYQYFTFNEPFTKRLLALQSIGQRKGGSKTIKKMQKVPKISSALHLSKRRTKDQKTKLSYSHWLQWWPYLSWSNRISLIKLIWLIQLLHLGTFWVNNTHIWTTINAKRGYFSSITSKIASSILTLSAIRHCINFQPFLNHRNTENHDFD